MKNKMSRAGVRWMTALVVLVIVVLSVVLFRSHLSAPGATAVVAAPPFQLPDGNKKITALSDFRGKVVLLDFWATWCVPCVVEIPALIRLQHQWGPDQFTVVGISIDEDGPERVRSFVKEHGITYPILLTGGEVVEGYDVTALPTAYLIDQQGNIIKRYEGMKSPKQLKNDIQNLLP